MNKMCRLMIVIICLLLSAGMTVSAASNDNYVYDYYTGEPVLEPDAYEAETVITAQTIGVETLSEPQDIFMTEDGKVYLADSGNHRVLILDSDWRLLSVISEFEDEQGKTALQSPHGVYVSSAGELYVADTGSQRIVVFSTDGTYLRQYGRPDSPLLDDVFLFAPVKVVANEAGKMFVVSENEIKGILQIDRDGTFIGYYGAVQTVPNLAESIWRLIATDEQLERMAQVVPTNYSNLDMDEDGFIYTTVSAVDADSSYDTSLFVRRLNPMGNDVLRRDSWLPITGDYQTKTGNLCKLCDISVMDNGTYSVLGQEYSRVYTYDHNGNLLFVFGSKGQEYGQLQNPTALASLPNRRYAVLDDQLNQIVVYKPTAYATLLLDATEAFYNRQYELSEQKFTEALQYSSKSDLVYTGVGRAMLRNGKYQEAMDAFRKGNNSALYSEAFGYYRTNVGRQLFPWVLGGAVVLIGAWLVASRVRRRHAITALVDSTDTFRGNLRYGRYVIFHPFNGFWCLQRERKRTGWAAVILLLTMVVICICAPQLTAYLFYTDDRRNISIFVQVAKVLLPYAVWCVGNWCITTLVNGEGSLKHIAQTTSYALIPLIFTRILLVAMSHILTYNEQVLYTMVSAIGWIWFGLLLFIGIMTIHQFSVPKTVLTILLAAVAAVIILLLLLVLFALVGKLTGFTSILWRESLLRF